MRWRQGEEECFKVFSHRGGMTYADGRVVLDPDWPWTPDSLRSCLNHELVHAM